MWRISREQFLIAGGAFILNACNMPKQSERDTATQPKTISVETQIERRLPNDAEREKFHYKIEGEVLPLTKQLYLPFSKSDLPKISVGQGWLVNQSETRISRVVAHQAIDFASDWGTKLYSPGKGWILASWQDGWRRIGDNPNVLTHPDTGEKIAYGGGLFVEILLDDDQRIQILHMASLGDEYKTNEKEFVPFSIPQPDNEGGWNPTGQSLPPEEFKKFARPIEVGELIGTVGFTGLGLGIVTVYKGEKRPPVVQKGSFKTWDEVGPHPHVELFKRNNKGTKYARRDILCVYRAAPDYSINGEKPLHKDALVKTDSSGAPLCAA